LAKIGQIATRGHQAAGGRPQGGLGVRPGKRPGVRHDHHSLANFRALQRSEIQCGQFGRIGPFSGYFSPKMGREPQICTANLSPIPQFASANCGHPERDENGASGAVALRVETAPLGAVQARFCKTEPDLQNTSGVQNSTFCRVLSLAAMNCREGARFAGTRFLAILPGTVHPQLCCGCLSSAICRTEDGRYFQLAKRAEK